MVKIPGQRKGWPQGSLWHVSHALFGWDCVSQIYVRDENVRNENISDSY